MAKQRVAEVKRTSQETSIAIQLDLDGTGIFQIETSIPFFDHMLAALCKHSSVDLNITASGDTEVDDHHLVEDVGICLGDAFKQALADCKGIVRFGHFLLAMEETLVEVALDISGRPYLVYNVETPDSHIKEFQVQLLEEFMRAFCNRMGLNLHINLKAGKNTHHICEAVFKGVARALQAALKQDLHQSIPSTKGLLD